MQKNIFLTLKNRNYRKIDFEAQEGLGRRDQYFSDLFSNGDSISEIKNKKKIFRKKINFLSRPR